MTSELKGLGWSQRSKSRRKEGSAPRSLHVEINEESKPEATGPPLHITDLQDLQQEVYRAPVISGRQTNEAYFNKNDFMS